MTDTKPVERWNLIIALVALLIAIITAAITFVLWSVATNSERARLRLEYVRLAVSVLHPTDKDNPPQKELREWGVDVLQDSSPVVKLPPEARRALIDGESYFYVPYTSGGDYTPPFTSSGADYNSKKPATAPKPK